MVVELKCVGTRLTHWSGRAGQITDALAGRMQGDKTRRALAMEGNTSSAHELETLAHTIQVLDSIIDVLIGNLQECEPVELYLDSLEQKSEAALLPISEGPKAHLALALHAEVKRKLAALRMKLQNRREQLAAEQASKNLKQAVEARRVEAQRQRQEAEQDEDGDEDQSRPGPN